MSMETMTHAEVRERFPGAIIFWSDGQRAAAIAVDAIRAWGYSKGFCELEAACGLAIATCKATELKPLADQLRKNLGDHARLAVATVTAEEFDRRLDAYRKVALSAAEICLEGRNSEEGS
jgi:hypothetical protein